MKLGVIEDSGNKQRLAKLVRFPSTHAPEGLTSLDAYISRMPESQTDIYYLAGVALSDKGSCCILDCMQRWMEHTRIQHPVPRPCVHASPVCWQGAAAPIPVMLFSFHSGLGRSLSEVCSMQLLAPASAQVLNMVLLSACACLRIIPLQAEEPSLQFLLNKAHDSGLMPRLRCFPSE